MTNEAYETFTTLVEDMGYDGAVEALHGLRVPETVIDYLENRYQAEIA